MDIPLWMLLGYALWTIAVLVLAIGTYRFSRILTGRAGMASFPADGRDGAAWYQRAMRAHANCVENLPLFIAVVFALEACGVRGRAVDWMAATALLARIGQSVVHIATVQTNRVVTVRFGLFFLQLLCFVGMAVAVAGQCAASRPPPHPGMKSGLA
jgi:uncharacterized MAPEG superfamily protein